MSKKKRTRGGVCLSTERHSENDQPTLFEIRGRWGGGGWPEETKSGVRSVGEKGSGWGEKKKKKTRSSKTQV